MNILQKLFQGKCIPVSEHGGNSSCEYEVAVEKLCKIAETLRQYGVPEELISALDKAKQAAESGKPQSERRRTKGPRSVQAS